MYRIYVFVRNTASGGAEKHISKRKGEKTDGLKEKKERERERERKREEGEVT
jgi:hypothetical protein